MKKHTKIDVLNTAQFKNMKQNTMSENIYYKDDGEPCQLCVDSDGYCHHHIDMASDDDTATLHTSSLEDGISHCPSCKQELEVTQPVVYSQQFNDARVNIFVELQCGCASAQIPFGESHVQKDILPEVWR